MNEIVLYGVPLALLVNIIMGIIEFYFPEINTKLELTIRGVLGILSALLVLNLPDIEMWLPWVATYLPQLVTALVIFASFIGVSDKVRVKTSQAFFAAYRKFSMRKNGLSEAGVGRGDQKD